MMQFSKMRTVAVAALATSMLFAARPFSTDDAGTVAPSGFEVELGTRAWQDDAGFDLSLKHGLTNRMDAGVNLVYTVMPDSNAGFERTEAVAKFAIIPALFSVSFTAILGDLNYMLNGIVTQTLGPVELDMNLGYETTGIQGIDGTVRYSFLFVYHAGRFATGAEVTGCEDELQLWLAGVRYTLFPGCALDGGFSAGFQEESAAAVTAGIHYEF